MIPSDDSFISEEEEEFCPLCVEEMDISDKNFKPCPCGYQICQFCYNNIRQNPELNGRCPGCRRLYDDESVEYKTISSDEYKSQQLKREKRDREKKQREKEKKETEMANKKHLAGLRVVQKNLVYVTGLNPPCSPEDLHSVLRSDKYFGQYGKISKIVINKKPPTSSGSHHHHSSPGLVVYVTFTRKEDALKCINELDGTSCDGRILRAAHGTTKYCSSYLRGHPCPNPNCMFLHEPGEEADSYTRKDLSTQQGIKMGMSGIQSGSRVASSSNISSQYYHDDDYYTDDHHTPSSAHASTAKPAGPILPATAHWATGNAPLSSTNSPQVSNQTPLANAAAFPTLGEIFNSQKQQQKKDVKKNKTHKASKDAVLAADDISIEGDYALSFVDQAVETLRGMASEEPLKVKLDIKASTSSVPLFSFEPNECTDTSLEDENALARQVIERFIFRPLKNYHLAYQNHPVSQQQNLLQAQLQQQAQQQNLMQVQLQQQHPPVETKMDQASPHQVRQQLLLAQLQQQSRPAMRLNGGTSTPPPGLFQTNSQKGQHEVYNGNVSSSSQLLTQLMSGKK